MKQVKNKTTDVVLIACHSGSLLQNTPLGAGSLCAALPPSCRCEILNLPPDFDLEYICEKVSDLKPKVIGFSLYVWNRTRLQDLAHALRYFLPDTVFIAGGPEVSCNTSSWQQNSKSTPVYDVVIQGHAELLFKQAVVNVLDGTFVRSAETQSWCEIGTLLIESPWLNGVLEPQRGVLLETARGCPFRCAYCFDARGSHAVTQTPYMRLQKELELFVARGVEQVWVLDSSFNVPCFRGKELLHLFLEYAPRIHYHLEAKAEYIDAETAQLLAQLSCSVQVGLQSVHAQVLENVDRTLDMPRFEAGLFELYQHGITYGIDLIYGLPGDTYAGLCKSLEATLEFYPNQIELFPLALLPGTILEQRRAMFTINALPDPPYTVTSTSSMDTEAFSRAAVLTAALNLFYNTGRAVAYFEVLCSACNCNGVEFLEHLGIWLEHEGHISTLAPLPDWEVEQAYKLQHEFVRTYFSKLGLENLVPAALDIMHYHYLYAETILAPALVPRAAQDSNTAQIESGSWSLAEGVRMGEFSYPVELYHTTGVEDLIEFVYLNPTKRCGALFYRDPDGEVECRVIPVEVVELFRSCIGATQLPAQFGSLEPSRTAAWLQEALESGILLQRPS